MCKFCKIDNCNCHPDHLVRPQTVNVTKVLKTGSKSQPGANGSAIHAGNVPPTSGVGKIGDFYIDLSTTSFYGPKTVNGWGTSKFHVKGDPFVYSDFTPEQIEGLKVKGEPFRYSDFTLEQLAALKGEVGNTPRMAVNQVNGFWEVSYDNGETWESTSQLARGPQGLQGLRGEGLKVDGAGIFDEKPEDPEGIYLYFATDQEKFYLYSNGVWTEAPSIIGLNGEMWLPEFDLERPGGYDLRSIVESSEGKLFVSLVANNTADLDDTNSWKEIKPSVEVPLKGIRVNGQFISTDTEGIANITIPDAPIQEIFVNGVKKDPINGQIDINTVENVEQTLDPFSSNPVSSSAVAAGINDINRNLPVRIILNENGEEESRTISASILNEEGDIIDTSEEVLIGSGTGGGGGEVSTSRIILTKISPNQIIKEGDEINLTYFFDHVERETGESTGLLGRALITVSSGAISETESQTLFPGSNYTIRPKNLLVGTNNIRVRVEVDAGGVTPQVYTISWSVQVITLRLTSSFNFARAYLKGENISVPFSVSGSGAKKVKCYLNGVEIDERTITQSSASGSFSIPTDELPHGSNSIQLVVELITSTAAVLKSNSIYFDAVVRHIGVNTPIIGARFNYNDGRIIGAGQRPTVAARQFEDFILSYAGYNPLSAQNTIKVIIDGEVVSETISSFVQLSTVTRSNYQGISSGIINLGTTNYTFGLEISDSGVNIEEPTDNLIFKLSALGRSNADLDRDQWENNGVTTTLSNIQYSGDGWMNGALRLMNGGKAIVNYKPLDIVNQGPSLNSFAVTLKLKVTDVTNPNAVLVSCMHNGIGFEITSEEARMITAGNSSVSMKFAPDEEYNIAFVSLPTSNALSSDYEKIYDKMVILYINGKLMNVVRRGVGDNIYQSGSPAYITAEANGATVDLFNLRCYNSYLTSDQVLSIYNIDLSSIDDVREVFERNNIVDPEGDVTIDSLPEGARYMIFTGEGEYGLTIIEYLQAIGMTAKDTRLTVSHMLHVVKGDDFSLNWVCLGGHVRAQGTSSMAYPIKNLRPGFRTASSGSVFGEVRVGCDPNGNGGNILEGVPKISFRKTEPISGKIPTPTNLWTLKADYAESSGSHNTGMVRMANDSFKYTGSPTPAQENVSPTYPYDVRTTIDGEPCYVFHRAKTTDKPIFLGKYNFNNDKSTQEVFGFEKITGYHIKEDGSPSDWVINKFSGKNPTECWEFLNNDYPMGKFLVDDFDALDTDGKKLWTKSFEARFPDNQDDYDDGTLGKPYYLERLVKWVKSTQGNPSKFVSEVGDYFDLDNLTKYFAYTQLLAAVDQMVKNAMIAFFYHPESDKMLAHYIFYDGDTILGVRNDGRLKYEWDIDRNTIDPEWGEHAFMGRDSVLWNHVETSLATQVGQSYRDLRSYLTNERIFQYFDRDQTEKFPERIFNIDAQNKYIIPATLGIPTVQGTNVTNVTSTFLQSAQGDRKSHRRLWLLNRLDLFDARYSTGQYPLTDITWKGVSAIGAKVSVEMSREYYVEFKRENETVAKAFVETGDTWTYTYPQIANIGTIFHLFGGKFFKKLDLSEWGGFADLQFPVLLNLENLILGKIGMSNSLSELIIGNKFPLLRRLDITNFQSLPSLDLSQLRRLEEVIASSTPTLGTINLPSGAPINNLVLGSGLTTLKLSGLPVLSNENIEFPEGNSVTNLIVEQSPNIRWEELFDELGNVQNIRITGLSGYYTKDFLDKFKNLGGIDINGNTVSNARLIGSINLTTYLSPSDLAVYKNAYPELDITVPNFSEYILHLGVSASKNFYNMDNNTGYIPGLVVQNRPYVPYGHGKMVLDKIHRYLSKHSSQGIYSITQLNDQNSNNFVDGSSANVLGAMGDIFTKFPSFWYKSITDLENNRTHLFISSNQEKPELGDCTVINPSSENIQLGVCVRTSTGSLESNPSMKVVSVNVAGFKKVAFNMYYHNTVSASANYLNIGARFLNSNGISIGTLSNSDSKYSADGRTIRNIPEGAVTLQFTVVSTVEVSEVVLTNSNRVVDLQKDWVKKEEKLISTFLPSIHSNKIRSVSGAPAATFATYDSAIVYLNDRALDAIGYTEQAELAMLALLKIGDTNVKGVIGTGTTPAASVMLGESVPYGIQQTSLGTYGGTPTSDNHTNFLGLEHFFGGKYIVSTLLNPIEVNEASSFPAKYKLAENRKWTVHSPIGSYEVTTDSVITSNTPKYLLFGKYFDIVPVGKNDPGTTSTFLSSINLPAGSVFTTGMHRHTWGTPLNPNVIITTRVNYKFTIGMFYNNTIFGMSDVQAPQIWGNSLATTRLLVSSKNFTIQEVSKEVFNTLTAIDL